LSDLERPIYGGSTIENLDDNETPKMGEMGSKSSQGYGPFFTSQPEVKISQKCKNQNLNKDSNIDDFSFGFSKKNSSPLTNKLLQYKLGSKTKNTSSMNQGIQGSRNKSTLLLTNKHNYTQGIKFSKELGKLGKNLSREALSTKDYITQNKTLREMLNKGDNDLYSSPSTSHAERLSQFEHKRQTSKDKRKVFIKKMIRNQMKDVFDREMANKPVKPTQKVNRSKYLKVYEAKPGTSSSVNKTCKSNRSNLSKESAKRSTKVYTRLSNYDKSK
jgi:hypothetical protein